MSTILKVRSTAVYEAIQLNTDDDEQIVLGWLQPLLPEDATVDLSPLREQHAYVLRGDDGNTAPIAAADFLSGFEEVGADEPTFHLGSPITEEEISHIFDGDNKNFKQPE